MTSEQVGPNPTEAGPTIGAVLLAAGRSERFTSGNKLLARIDGQQVVNHAAAAVLTAEVAELVAVVGHEAAAVRAALPEQFETRFNEGYADGQHTSIQTGVSAARERGWDATLFVLGDMPAVSPDTIRALYGAFADGGQDIVVPTTDGQRGNPVLFGATQFEALAGVTGDRGGRQFIESQKPMRVPVDDPGIHQDIDSREDLESFRS